MQRKSSRNDYRTYKFIARSGTPFDCGDLFAILILENASSYGCSRIIWKKRGITKERYRRSMNRVAIMTSQSYRVLLKIIYKLALSFFFWAIEKKIFDIFSNTEVRLTKDLFGLFELYYLLAYPDNDSSRNNDVFAVLPKRRNYTNSSWISHRM